MRMFWSPFQRKLPAEVASALSISGRDRVLAFTRLAGGGMAVATTTQLLIRDAAAQVLRRSWSDVDYAEWETDSSTLVVRWEDSATVMPLEVLDAARFPEVVRERVQASVLISGTVTGPSGATIRLALRRAADGGVREQILAPREVDLDDYDTTVIIDRGLRNLRSEVALDTQEIVVMPGPVPGAPGVPNSAS